MAQIASKTCEICVSAPGEYHCQQCEQMFCNNCKVGHLRSKSTRNHTFVTGEEIDKEVTLICGKHKELFIYHCLQCDTQICKICVVKTHKGHDISELSEYTENLQKNVRTAIEDKIQILQFNANRIEKGTSQYRLEVKTAIFTITEEGNRLKQLIDRKVDELIQQVKKHETEQMKKLTSMQNDLKNNIDNVKKYKQQLETFQKGCHDETINKQIKQLQLDVETLTEQQLPTMPSLSYNPEQIYEEAITDLFGILDMRTTQSGKYLYRCTDCRTEQRSDEKPYDEKPYDYYGNRLRGNRLRGNRSRGDYSPGVFMDCEKCGERIWHYHIREKR